MLRIQAICLVSATVALAALAADLDGDGRDDVTLAVTGSSALDAGVTGDDVVHSIPTPQGVQAIVWVCEEDETQGTLFVSDLWNYTIYELDPSDGTVLNSFPSADPAGVHGVAWDGRYLIQNGYDTNVSWFTNKDTGAIYYTRPSSGGRGITWGTYHSPHDDQWLWVAKHWSMRIYQDDYYTGENVGYLGCTGFTVGAGWDGSYLWDANWLHATLSRYEPEQGFLVNTIAAPYYNPRDICWDGHYLWSIHWENRTAYQIDLWLSAGLYPLTQYMNPRYIHAHAGDDVVINVSFKNHTDTPYETDIWLEAQEVSSPSTYVVKGPVHVTLQPGQFANLFPTLHVPNGVPEGVWILHLRCGQVFPQWDGQDGIIVEIAP